MGDITLKTRIQLRNDTESNWKLVKDTFIPLSGEVCITNDGENKGRFKVGDGTSKWGELPYSGGGADIKVDASQVTFSQDLIFTEQFGKYVPENGQVTVPADGNSLLQVLLDAYSEERNPTINQPSASVSSSQMKAYEAGTNVTPSYTTNLNPGSYQFGPATGITANAWNVTLDSQTLQTASGSFNQIQVTDDTNVKINATISYGGGSIPVTNLGNQYTEGQIKAGSKTASTGALTGFRQIFYGVSKDTEPLTSALIRALTNTNNKASGRTITVNASSGAKRIIVAIPASSNLRITAANITTSLNADVTNSYILNPEVQVEGANGYSAVAYNVYVYQPASIDPTESHKIVIG